MVSYSCNDKVFDETEYFRVYSLLCCMFYGAEHISNNMDSTFKLF